MRLEKPGLRGDVVFRDQPAQTGLSPTRPELHPVDHLQPALVEPRRAVEFRCPVRQCDRGRLRKRLQHTGFHPQTHLVLQRLGAEEPERRLHRHHDLVVLCADDIEEHDRRTGAVGEPLQRRGDPQRADPGRPVLDHVAAVEVTEHHVIGSIGGKPVVRRQPPAGLQQDLDQHRHRDGVDVCISEIPFAGRDIVFGDHGAALGRHPRRAGHAEHPRHEVVGLVRKARRAAGAVERGVQRTEGVRRHAATARQQRTLVTADVFGAFQDPDRAGGARRHRPVRNEAHSEAAAVEYLETVAAAQQRGEHRRCRPVDDLLDEDLVVEHVVGVGRHLSTTDEARHVVGDGLEPPAVAFDREAVGGHRERQRLGGGIGHQGAGHAGIVLEMPVVEPHVLGHRGGRTQIPPAPRSAVRIEFGDLVDQPQPALRKRRRAGVRGGALEAGPEAAVRVPFGERLDVGPREGALSGDHGRFVADRPLARCVVGGVPQHPVGLGEFGVGEETGLAVAHRDHQPVADIAVVVEEEQPGVTGFRVTVDVDLVVQRVAALGQLTHEREITPEQAVDPFAAVGEVRAEPRGEQQVRLAAFDHHTGRHPAVVDVPGVRIDVGLGDDCAGAHLSGFTLDAHHPVGQQQRGLRHPHQTFVLVVLGELRPHDLRNLAAGKDFKLFPCPQRLFGRRRPPARCRLRHDGCGCGDHRRRCGCRRWRCGCRRRRRWRRNRCGQYRPAGNRRGCRPQDRGCTRCDRRHGSAPAGDQRQEITTRLQERRVGFGLPVEEGRVCIADRRDQTQRRRGLLVTRRGGRCHRCDRPCTDCACLRDGLRHDVLRDHQWRGMGGRGRHDLNTSVIHVRHGGASILGRHRRRYLHRRLRRRNFCLGDRDDIGPVRGQRQPARAVRRGRLALFTQVPDACLECVDVDRDSVHPQLAHALGKGAQSAPLL